MIYEIKHFEKGEFACKCCGREMIAPRLVFFLDIIRRVANSPIVVNSGYRCPEHNEKIGGSATSRHMIGCAADIATPKTLNYEAFASLARRIAGDGFEIVTYPSRTYIHFAIPRESIGRGWQGGHVQI